MADRQGDLHNKVRERTEALTGFFYCISCRAQRPTEAKIRKGRRVLCTVCAPSRKGPKVPVA